MGGASVLLYDRTGNRPGVRLGRYLCGSWRCRVCGPLDAAKVLNWIQGGMGTRDWWLYLVLTFDPSRFACTWDAYDAFGKLWEKRLLRRLERAFGKLTYVRTTERHVGGRRMPHFNIALSSDTLRDVVERSGVVRKFDKRAGHGGGRWCKLPRSFRRWLNPIVEECGFGKRLWVEVVDDAHGMGAYIAKCAHDLGAARFKAGNQVPHGCPPHFRRYAAGGDFPKKPERPPTEWGMQIVRTRPEHVPRVVDENGDAVLDDDGEPFVNPEWAAQAIERERDAAAMARERRRVEGPRPRSAVYER